MTIDPKFIYALIFDYARIYSQYKFEHIHIEFLIK